MSEVIQLSQICKAHIVTTTPIFQKGKGVTEMLSDFPKVTQLVSKTRL